VIIPWLRDRLDRLGLVDSLWALIGGGIATAIILAVVYTVGSVSGYSALQLLDAALPSVRFLTSTVATGGVTILALMVTLLGLSHSVETELERVHYHRIQQIAYMSTFAIAAAILLLVFLSIPVEQSEDVVLQFAEWVYYGVIGMTSVLGGVMITLVLMLLTAVRGLLHVVAPSLEGEPSEIDG
jgi:hypothetical protein